jgi:hypothetical protein
VGISGKRNKLYFLICCRTLEFLVEN